MMFDWVNTELNHVAVAFGVLVGGINGGFVMVMGVGVEPGVGVLVCTGVAEGFVVGVTVVLGVGVPGRGVPVALGVRSIPAIFARSRSISVNTWISDTAPAVGVVVFKGGRVVALFAK